MNRKDRHNKLNDIRLVADSLRSAPIQAPDFTSSILDRVDAERAFLAPSVRRKIPFVRLGLLGGLAMLGLSGALILRYAPQSVQVVERPAPFSAVLSTVEDRAQVPIEVLRQTVAAAPLASIPDAISQLFPESATVEPPAGVARLAVADAGEAPSATLSSATVRRVSSAAGDPVVVGTAFVGSGFAGAVFVGPVLPLEQAVELAALRSQTASDDAALSAREALSNSPQGSLAASISGRAPRASVLLSSSSLLGARLESSMVPAPRPAPLPVLLDAASDDVPSIK